MTRVTNFGIKRTYVQAGFSDTVEVEKPNESEALPAPPPKKKRKRTKMSQRDGNKAVLQQEGVAQEPEGQPESAPPAIQPIKVTTKKSKPKTKKSKKAPYVSPADARRLKRIEERNASTTCFACRLKGHSARDCPSSQSGDKSNSALGICYRCGSTKHTLTRCKKQTDPTNPLPFASCFVCTGKGHLASACPQGGGIYPNGGCCKLCGETSHLAKDCGVRKQGRANETKRLCADLVPDSMQDSTMLGVGREAGADEDDFHILKRRKTEVDHDEKLQVKMKRVVDDVNKPYGNNLKPKKVVFF
ncbi:hypothetical protein B0H12DRAFT_1191377 [Mycena haematopus]|nr:hypothetical protein B0H12DRAFT_1191377 [Mycena haematopus]